MRNSLTKLAVAGALSIAMIGASVSADAAALKVANMSSEAIAYVYVSPTWTGTFRPQDETLGSQYIRPGQTWVLPFRGGDDCYFDLRAVLIDGTNVDRYDEDLCYGTVTWTISE
jgi:hypothetical protein